MRNVHHFVPDAVQRRSPAYARLCRALAVHGRPVSVTAPPRQLGYSIARMPLEPKREKPNEGSPR